MPFAAVNLNREPFIKFKKKNVKLPFGKDGNKMTEEEAALLTQEAVIKLVEEELGITVKPAPKKKVPAAKKPAAKKK